MAFLTMSVTNALVNIYIGSPMSLESLNLVLYYNCLNLVLQHFYGPRIEAPKFSHNLICMVQITLYENLFGSQSWAMNFLSTIEFMVDG